MANKVKYDVKDNIAYITLSRPEALNALNAEVLNDVIEVFNKFSNDHNALVAILTGEGKAFAAGADIKAMSTMTVKEGRAISALGNETMLTVENLEKPVIAAVNGYALGGGCELSMACDIRIASKNAKFGLPETGLGVTPGFGGSQRLSRLIGKGRAKYLIFTGEIIDAEKALEYGLVEFVVEPDEVINMAEKIAHKIISKAPFAIAKSKSIIDKGYNLDIKTAVGLEIDAFGACFGTSDQKEGMKAFIEKRPAKFENK